MESQMYQIDPQFTTQEQQALDVLKGLSFQEYLDAASLLGQSILKERQEKERNIQQFNLACNALTQRDEEIAKLRKKLTDNRIPL
jgi:Leucine-rich repeat (LRR) protein